MYTTHGHQIPGTPVEGEKPKSVARCSAFFGCPQCQAESAKAYKNSPKGKIDAIKDIMDENRVDLQTAIRMFNRRCKPGTKVCDWSNSDGRFGVAVVEKSDGGQMEIITEIEMTPDELIALAMNCLILAERKRGHESI